MFVIFGITWVIRTTALNKLNFHQTNLSLLHAQVNELQLFSLDEREVQGRRHDDSL